MKRTVLVAAMMATAIGGSSGIPAAQSTCAPSGGLEFICGVHAPEDLVLVPNTRWLIASGATDGNGLSLIDTRAKTARNLFSSDVSSARQDKTTFGGCPGALDPKLAVFQGLSLRPAETGRYRLYAANHGGRESVEVFEVDARGQAPSAVWIGCVLLPDKLAANSVAVFGDGAIVATVLMLPGTTFDDLVAGRNTGIVLMWTPGSKDFRMLPGTELSGNNGIETSADNREFYVVSTFLMRIVAFSRADSSRPIRFAQLKEFRPDNLRLVGNRLMAAGMVLDEPSCGGRITKPADVQCPRGWIADAIDPKTMAISEIGRGPAAPPYRGTATAIPVGNDLWLSSFGSDRVAYRPLKR